MSALLLACFPPDVLDEDRARSPPPPPSWIDTHLAKLENCYLCKVDKTWACAVFNPRVLVLFFPNYRVLFDIVFDMPTDVHIYPGMELVNETEVLYGLIHARYILTEEGKAKIAVKYMQGAYGRCPSPGCAGQRCLPNALYDVPFITLTCKYCPVCRINYMPLTPLHSVDGSYFGTKFLRYFLEIPDGA